MAIQEKYNGYIITYSEYISMFECNIGNCETLQSPTLSGIKAKIDAAIKRQKAFKKIKCYATSGYYGASFEEAEITSVNLETRKIYYTQTEQDGTKRKQYAMFNSLINKKIFAEYSDKNKAIFEKIKCELNQIEEIKKTISILESEMDTLKELENLINN